MSENGWSEYQKMVLHRLDSADQRLLMIEERLRKISITVERHTERLNITAATYGFVAGAIPALLVFLTGCVSAPKSVMPPTGGFAVPSMAAAGIDPMLSWIGGLSILAGIAGLVLTRGSMGTRALAVGIGLVLLNQAMARYGDWLFLPTIIATGAISVAYAYTTVRKIIQHRRSPQ